MEFDATKTRQNRLRRRRAWAIGIVAVFLAFGGLAAIYFTAGTMFRDSDAFHLAVAAAQASPVVLAKVGSPVETGRFISGNMEVSPAAGHAELSIPVSGPRGHGKLYVEAHKSAGIWSMTVLKFVPAGSSAPIDLLPAAPAPVSVN